MIFTHTHHTLTHSPLSQRPQFFSQCFWNGFVSAFNDNSNDNNNGQHDLLPLPFEDDADNYFRVWNFHPRYVEEVVVVVVTVVVVLLYLLSLLQLLMRTYYLLALVVILFFFFSTRRYKEMINQLKESELLQKVILLSLLATHLHSHLHVPLPLHPLPINYLCNTLHMRTPHTPQAMHTTHHTRHKHHKHHTKLIPPQKAEEELAFLQEMYDRFGLSGSSTHKSWSHSQKLWNMTCMASLVF